MASDSRKSGNIVVNTSHDTVNPRGRVVLGGLERDKVAVTSDEAAWNKGAHSASVECRSAIELKPRSVHSTVDVIPGGSNPDVASEQEVGGGDAVHVAACAEVEPKASDIRSAGGHADRSVLRCEDTIPSLTCDARTAPAPASGSQLGGAVTVHSGLSAAAPDGADAPCSAARLAEAGGSTGAGSVAILRGPHDQEHQGSPIRRDAAQVAAGGSLVSSAVTDAVLRQTSSERCTATGRCCSLPSADTLQQSSTVGPVVGAISAPREAAGTATQDEQRQRPGAAGPRPGNVVSDASTGESPTVSPRGSRISGALFLAGSAAETDAGGDATEPGTTCGDPARTPTHARASREFASGLASGLSSPDGSTTPPPPSPVARPPDVGERRLPSNVEVYKSREKGYGLRATEFIPKNTEILWFPSDDRVCVEKVPIARSEALRQRLKFEETARNSGQPQDSMLSIERVIFWDRALSRAAGAAASGSWWYYLNHAHARHCTARWELRNLGGGSDPDYRAVLVARVDVHPYTPLEFHYGVPDSNWSGELDASSVPPPGYHAAAEREAHGNSGGGRAARAARRATRRRLARAATGQVGSSTDTGDFRERSSPPSARKRRRDSADSATSLAVAEKGAAGDSGGASGSSSAARKARVPRWMAELLP